MVYAAQFATADLSAMGVDTAGGVMGQTAAQSGNVASLGIFSGTTMPLLGKSVSGSADMLTSIGGPAATANADSAQERAKRLCKTCQGEK